MPRDRSLEEWWFQDAANKKIHGPHPRRHMRSWFKQEHLQEDMLVSVNPTSGFFLIKEFYPNTENSFLGSPMDPNIVKALPIEEGWDTKEKGWYFIGSNDEPEGPFSSIQMWQWFMQQHFDSSLLVYNMVFDTSNWLSIQKLYPDNEYPFLTKPRIEFPHDSNENENKPRESRPLTLAERVDNIQFDLQVPTPPPFGNLTKIYPSERNKSLQPLEVIDVFGNPV